MSDVVNVLVTEQTTVNVPVTPVTVTQSDIPGVVSVVAPIVNTGSSTSAVIGLDMSYLGAYDSTQQTITSTTTAYKLGINTTYTAHGISLSNSRMTFSKSGTYNLTFSIQFVSSDNAPQDATVWTRWNGVDAPFTSSVATVPQKRGNIRGKTVMQVSFIGGFAANDYLELWWHADSTNVSIQTLAAGTNPTTPASPGVIALLQQIAS